jgi:hypothetical protein
MTTKHLFTFGLLTLTLTLARPAFSADEKPTAATPAAAPEKAQPGDNTPPEGFTALFNGKDLANWKGLLKPPLDNPYKREPLSAEDRSKAQAEADENMRKHWSAQDGVLLYDGKAGGRSLCTAKDYGDFEMYVDWKIGPEGDSGIYLRGTPQVQIWDPSSKPAAGVGSGGLYNNQKNPSKPTAKADKPIGQWNRFWIKMVGDKVWVKLNDQLVVDGVPLENYWARQSPLPATGQIELQNHGSPLWFKNVYIKELPKGEGK